MASASLEAVARPVATARAGELEAESAGTWLVARRVHERTRPWLSTGSVSEKVWMQN